MTDAQKKVAEQTIIVHLWPAGKFKCRNQHLIDPKPQRIRNRSRGDKMLSTPPFVVNMVFSTPLIIGSYAAAMCQLGSQLPRSMAPIIHHLHSRVATSAVNRDHYLNFQNDASEMIAAPLQQLHRDNVFVLQLDGVFAV